MAVKRLSKIARELNVGITSLVDHLKDKGVDIEASPNAKVEDDVYKMLLAEFVDAKIEKEKSQEATAQREKKVERKIEETIKASADKLTGPAVVGKIDLTPKKKETEEIKKEEILVSTPTEEPKKKEPKQDEEVIRAGADKLTGPSIVGKIDLTPKKNSQRRA